MAHPIHPELLLLGFRVRLPPSLPPSHGGKRLGYTCGTRKCGMDNRYERSWLGRAKQEGEADQGCGLRGCVEIRFVYFVDSWKFTIVLTHCMCDLGQGCVNSWWVCLAGESEDTRGTGRSAMPCSCELSMTRHSQVIMENWKARRTATV